MTPREALYSATASPAAFFGLEGEIGQLAPGYLADAVLLSANPLENIAHTRTVEAVINRGTVLSKAALEELVSRN